MAKATGTGAWWCVMAFDCTKRDSLSLAKCWKTSFDCGIGLMRICEVVSVEMFPTSVHTNCHLQTTEGYSQVTCTVSLSALVFMFWLNVGLWFQICRGGLSSSFGVILGFTSPLFSSPYLFLFVLR